MLYSVGCIASLFILLTITLSADAGVLPADEYWQVSPSLNYSDVLFAGWNQIPIEKEIEVYNGINVGRTVC
jgi:hypothetical protein